MPFTVSHAVVAFAARRTALPVAAVAAGSMAPDAVLFVPWLPPYAFTHSWAGVVTVDLAVALVVVAAWWWLVRPAWTAALPAVARRVPEAWSTPPHPAVGTAAWTVVACVVGSVTHVAWDAFSHPHGWVVQRVALLRVDVAGHPAWAVVQDASSALGLLALLAALAVWWRRAGRRERVGHGSRAGREARVVLGAVVALVVGVTLVRCGRVALVGGGPGAVLVTGAFTIPPVVAVALVAGAVALLVLRARRAAGQVRPEAGPVRPEAGPGGTPPGPPGTPMR
ncbi:DUF4184 family protein [Curtobacterium sp. 'Ferrero']|uniref:DUF4184 family protein n=1 Tax=Curtobacterium sp. 'Ferrero' TaxID=2033654 RepID=UPI0015969EBC|nr:DUF4184 family protein [Curtobacterium sp. 'Ferrero']